MDIDLIRFYWQHLWLIRYYNAVTCKANNSCKQPSKALCQINRVELWHLMCCCSDLLMFSINLSRHFIHKLLVCLSDTDSKGFQFGLIFFSFTHFFEKYLSDSCSQSLQFGLVESVTEKSRICLSRIWKHLWGMCVLKRNVMLVCLFVVLPCIYDI